MPGKQEVGLSFAEACRTHPESQLQRPRRKQLWARQ
jgi:hypothetical protein